MLRGAKNAVHQEERLPPDRQPAASAPGEPVARRSLLVLPRREADINRRIVADPSRG